MMSLLKYELLIFLRSSFFIYLLIFNTIALSFCFLSRWLSIDFDAQIAYDFFSFYIYFFGSLLGIFLGASTLSSHLRQGSALCFLSFGIKRHEFYLGLWAFICLCLFIFHSISYICSLALGALFEADLLPLDVGLLFIYQFLSFLIIASISLCMSVFFRFEVAFFAGLGALLIGLNAKTFFQMSSYSFLKFLGSFFDLSIFMVRYEQILPSFFYLFCYAGFIISFLIGLGLFLFSKKDLQEG